MKKQLEDYKRRLQQIIGAMPCGYLYGEVVVDGDGIPINYSVLDINHALADIASITKNKVTGKRIAGLFSLSSIKEDISVFSKVALTGDPIEKKIYSPKLDKHLSLFCFSPELGYFIALLTDMTIQKRYETSLGFIRSFGNSTSDEFFILDSKAKFVAGNAAVGERLGVSEEKIPGLHFSVLNAMATDEWWITLWSTLLEKGSLQFETDHRGVDNIAYPVELSIDLMTFEEKQFATMVAKNISSKRALTTALKQDRKFAEKAASIAGYFIWMLDSEGIFRPLLGTESGFNSGAVEDVFLSQIHKDDRAAFAEVLRLNKDGFEEFRLQTSRGFVYHKSKWSTSEDNVIIGICYPLSGGGLAGLGSESVAMDAINLYNKSLQYRFSKLKESLEKKEFNTSERIVRGLVHDYSALSEKIINTAVVDVCTFFDENESILDNLLQPSVNLHIDNRVKVSVAVDYAAFENILIRLILVIRDSNRVTDINFTSFIDSPNCGIKVQAQGVDGVQAELEKLFIPLKGSTPGLASVYSMVKNSGGQIYYDTFDNIVEFTISYPLKSEVHNTCQILVVLSDSVDSARAFGTLLSEGYSVKIGNKFAEIKKCIVEQNIELLIMSDSHAEFSLHDVMSIFPELKLLQVGGKPLSSNTDYLQNGFKTRDLISRVKKIIKVEKPRVEALPD